VLTGLLWAAVAVAQDSLRSADLTDSEHLATVRDELVATDQLIRQWTDRVTRRPVPFLQNRVREAQRMQGDAWHDYRGNSPLRALRRTLAARDLLSLPARGMERRRPDRGQEPLRIDRQADRIGAAITRSESLIDRTDAGAMETLKRAGDAHAAARRAMESGDWRSASDHLRHARAALRELLLSGDESINADAVAALIGESRERWLAIAARVGPPGSADIEVGLDQAGNNLDTAADALGSGRFLRALLHVRRANALLDEIEDGL
jgi:hypothetical protein